MSAINWDGENRTVVWSGAGWYASRRLEDGEIETVNVADYSDSKEVAEQKSKEMGCGTPRLASESDEA